VLTNITSKPHLPPFSPRKSCSVQRSEECRHLYEGKGGGATLELDPTLVGLADVLGELDPLARSARAMASRLLLGPLLPSPRPTPAAGLGALTAGLVEPLVGLTDLLGELDPLARSARAMARRSSLGPPLSGTLGMLAGLRAAVVDLLALAEPFEALEGLAVRLEKLPALARSAIAMARRLSLGGPSSPLPAAGWGILGAALGALAAALLVGLAEILLPLAAGFRAELDRTSLSRSAIAMARRLSLGAPSSPLPAAGWGILGAALGALAAALLVDLAEPLLALAAGFWDELDRISFTRSAIAMARRLALGPPPVSDSLVAG